MYALLENARRARLRASRADTPRPMGGLFEPFTRVAAKNPHASAPVERSAAELITATAADRPIADPYPRYLVAREKVNQGAAVVLMSVAAARRLGVPEDRWVFLHGHADTPREGPARTGRPGPARAHVAAARHALELAGIGAGDVATFDLYSLLPGRGVRRRGRPPARRRRPARAHPHRRASRSSVARATTTRCTASPRPCSAPAPHRQLRVRGRQRGHAEQVLGRRVLDEARLPGGRTAARPLQAELDAVRPFRPCSRPDGWATIETFTVEVRSRRRPQRDRRRAARGPPASGSWP